MADLLKGWTGMVQYQLIIAGHGVVRVTIG